MSIVDCSLFSWRCLLVPLTVEFHRRGALTLRCVRVFGVRVALIGGGAP